MSVNYYSDTDSLYIDLSNWPSAESEEVAPGVVLDFDSEGHIVGIDSEDASKIVDLSRLESSALPLSRMAVSA